jgi:hypothetical protein
MPDLGMEVKGSGGDAEVGSTRRSGNGDGDGANEAEIPAFVQVSDDLTS